MNLLERGDKTIVCQMACLVTHERECRALLVQTAVMVEDQWGTAVDPNKVEAALKVNPDAKVLAFVHGNFNGSDKQMPKP